MATLSIRDAARQVGVSRSSILRAIQSGRMSAPRKDDGGYAIDPAELFRVFEPKPRPEPLPAGQSDAHEPGHLGQTGQGSEPVQGAVPQAVTPHVTDVRAAALEAEIQALKELVRRLDQDRQELVRRFDQDRQDLRADRDAWKGQAERLAITGPTRRSWWLWRRSA
jgi:excisionase family DNA binding protein